MCQLRLAPAGRPHLFYVFLVFTVGMASVLERRVDEALVALSTGNRRRILELVRDEPAALEEMAHQFGLSPHAVSQDLSMLHMAEYEATYDALAARYDPRLLGAARLRPADRVVDIGCGAGVPTLAVARAVPSGTVLGVDLSAALLQRGRERARAASLSNICFEQSDAQTHAFEAASFDVAVSRFGAAYFADPSAAFANIGRALRPGGRLAVLAWQGLEHNEWMTAVRDALALDQAPPPLPPGTPGAFGLAEPAMVERMLTGAGYVDLHLEDAREPVTYGPDVERAFAFVSTLSFAKDVLARLTGRDRAAALERLRQALAAHDTGDGVWLPSAAWVITARRP
ncbi:MAG: methyltransferase domain-containing protein [Acidimicrobiales bacterium]